MIYDIGNKYFNLFKTINFCVSIIQQVKDIIIANIAFKK